MRGYSAIGLHNPKTPANVGSVLRAAQCYGVSMVALTGLRASKNYVRAATDPQKAYRHIPVLTVENLGHIIPYDCVPVAVELLEEAVSLYDYKHPERAFYVFGPEDGTLGRSVTSWCRDTIMIPTNYCMNLAATVNVILYDRALKGR